LISSTSVAPSAFAPPQREQPRRGTPRRCWCLAEQLRRLVEQLTVSLAMLAAAAAGPGFPRAPPSTWITSFTQRRLAARAQGGQVTENAPAAPVAHDPLVERRTV